MSDDSVHKFTVGTYSNPMNEHFEFNAFVLGIPLAQFIERAKTEQPSDTWDAQIIAVDVSTGTVTIKAV